MPKVNVHHPPEISASAKLAYTPAPSRMRQSTPCAAPRHLVLHSAGRTHGPHACGASLARDFGLRKALVDLLLHRAALSETPLELEESAGLRHDEQAVLVPDEAGVRAPRFR